MMNPEVESHIKNDFLWNSLPGNVKQVRKDSVNFFMLTFLRTKIFFFFQFAEHVIFLGQGL